MWLNNFFLLGFSINTVSIPYDNGANIQGSRFAPAVILKDLNKLPISSNLEINTNKIIKNFYKDAFFEVWNILKKKNIPLIIGGDHSVVIPGIFAVNEYINRFEKKKLGVIWIDAHADFNTMNSSPSKNIHGMPVSVLCHHTLPVLQMSQSLSPCQFAFFGVRDIDCLELERFQQHDMKILDTNEEVDEWINYFDKIHVSFDIDCLDPSEFNGVNTPVKNGKTIIELKNLFKKIKISKKLSSLDIVEYNPSINPNISIITDIVTELF